MIKVETRVLIQDCVRRLAHEAGITEATKRLGVAKITVARIASDLPVREGTLLVVARALGIAA